MPAIDGRRDLPPHANREFPPYLVLFAPTRLGRAVAAGAWLYRRWRIVVIWLHLGIVAIFATIAAIAAIALPGAFASFFLGASVVIALWFALRLPATLAFARRRDRAHQQRLRSRS